MYGATVLDSGRPGQPALTPFPVTQETQGYAFGGPSSVPRPTLSDPRDFLLYLQSSKTLLNTCKDGNKNPAV